jgi:hypothetical protein
MIHSRGHELITICPDNLSPPPEGMTHSGSPLLPTILEESPSKDDSVSSEDETSGSPLLRLTSLEGMPRDDARHPHHKYTTTRGDPDVLDRTNKVVVDHYIDARP